jgi:signal transduction histidine kinase
MSKSKEESINIINKEFYESRNKKEGKSLFLALEKSIKDISNSEFSLVWLINDKRKKINTLYKSERFSFDLEASILESVFLSKKPFFDNYVVSHRKYNQKIDNILNIKIKSMLVVPVLDKRTGEVVACIVAFNSVQHKGEFKRYDVRSLGLLEHYVLDLIKTVGYDLILTTEKEKSLSEAESIVPKVVQKTKAELEVELKIQKEKIRVLENEILLKTKALENKETISYTPTVLEDENSVTTSEIYTILDFLTNEVAYLANEEHKIYLFLEIIKNSLHNKEQLRFVNSELEKIELIEQLATELYTREKMPIISESFNIYQLVNDLTLLYGRTLVDKNITLNVFLNPLTPNFLYSDRYKIKSLMIHLINNIFNFTNNAGVIELNIEYLDNSEFLSIEIKGIKSQQLKEIKSFFKQQQVSHSLTSSDKGLGLSVSSNLINILGGKLKLSTLGENEHVFTVLLPTKKSKDEKKVEFLHPKVLKVAILMSEENRYVLETLIRYLLAMGIDEKFIVSFQNPEKMKNINFSHLFCFENMFSSELDVKNFSSVIVLKYSQDSLNIGRSQKNRVHELSINSYYGLKLQKILFPKMQRANLTKNTLLIEDSFLNKFSNVLKRLTFS